MSRITTQYDYRLYTLINMYFSSIQQGIQSAHVVGNLLAGKLENQAVKSWATIDKTMVVLNGGMTKDILEAHGKLETVNQEKYPVGVFHEDWDACNSLMSIGIVLPEEVYASLKQPDGSYISPAGIVWDRDSDEQLILDVIKPLSLAR
jgi:hypothetical protein